MERCRISDRGRALQLFVPTHGDARLLLFWMCAIRHGESRRSATSYAADAIKSSSAFSGVEGRETLGAALRRRSSYSTLHFDAFGSEAAAPAVTQL